MMQIKEAIDTLQRAMAKRYEGAKVDTGVGEATLYVAQDRIELTSEEGTVIATTEAAVTRLLEPYVI